MAYSRLIFHICLGFSANLSDAEDLYQEVYLKAWSALASIKNQDSARLWLLKIARNVSLDHLRRRRSGKRPLPESDFPLIERETPEKAAIRNEQEKVLKSAVRGLPKRYQVVFVMREYGELSYEEIASSLGIKTGTVMSRLSRARRNIIERLRENGYGQQNEE